MKRHGKLLAADTTFLVLLLVLLFSLHPRAASFSKKAPEPTIKFKGENLIIKWPKRSDLTGYEVYRCNASGQPTKLVRKTSACKVTLKKFKYGTTYYYKVRGYKEKKNHKFRYTRYSKLIKVPVFRKSTLKKLLLTALEPVGSTVYVWGGGWNEADTGAGLEATTIGVSPRWESFFNQQDSSYNYNNTRYQIHDGLDCSGYIGWCIYNILETDNGKPGYVMSAKLMAPNFASRGWGTFTAAGNVRNYRAGDIMSTASGHVWMVVGQCSDGSVVILHSSPPGVQLMGTPTPGGNTNSEAVALARQYMQKYFPTWYQKFPNCSRDGSYLTNYSQMRWDISGNMIMSDPDKYRNKTADQILADLFRSR